MDNGFHNRNNKNNLFFAFLYKLSSLQKDVRQVVQQSIKEMHLRQFEWILLQIFVEKKDQRKRERERLTKPCDIRQEPGDNNLRSIRKQTLVQKSIGNWWTALFTTQIYVKW